MSRSWGRAHLHWLGREPPLGPSPEPLCPGCRRRRWWRGARGRQRPADRRTDGPGDREAGRTAHGRTLRPAGPAPAPTRARRSGQVSGQRRASTCRPSAAPEPRSPSLPARRGRPSGRLCNRAGLSPLHRVLPGLRAAPRPCPGQRQGAGQRARVRERRGAAAGVGGGLLIPLYAPEAAVGSEVSLDPLLERAGLLEPVPHSWWPQGLPSQ